MRGAFRSVYVRSDGTPRNYTPPEIEPNTQPEDINRLYLEADVNAFRTTQRALAVGIIGVGGVIANILHAPDNIGDVVKNFTLPIVVQTLNYTTFRTGLSLLRQRVSERRQQ